MSYISSTEFRKRFARLEEPIIVTANGHPIGQWVPAVWLAEEFSKSPSFRDWIQGRSPNTRDMSQTQRDDLLRKINKR
jgi:hypothetical protein